MENLEELQKLSNLNLSSNYISKIENAAALPKLQTLALSRNKLSSAEDIKELTRCETLSVLDLSYNNLEAGAAVIEVLASMPNLRVLYLQGNPITRKTKDYRHVMISKCKELTYLDQRPVNNRERLAVEAWMKGGREEEKRYIFSSSLNHYCHHPN